MSKLVLAIFASILVIQNFALAEVFVQSPTYPIPEECQTIHELSYAMNKNTRNISLETLISMIALGAGRTSDSFALLFKKYTGPIDSDLNVLLMEKAHEQNKISRIKHVIEELREDAALSEGHPETLKNLSEIDSAMSESTDLTIAKKIRKVEDLEKILVQIERDIEPLEAAKAKYKLLSSSLPKVIQIFLGLTIIAYEADLCMKKSVSCLVGSVAELLNPIPITEMGNDTELELYENDPHSLIEDVARGVIAPEWACHQVHESKKLLQDFKIVTALLYRVRHPISKHK